MRRCSIPLIEGWLVRSNGQPCTQYKVDVSNSDLWFAHRRHRRTHDGCGEVMRTTSWEAWCPLDATPSKFHVIGYVISGENGAVVFSSWAE